MAGTGTVTECALLDLLAETVMLQGLGRLSAGCVVNVILGIRASSMPLIVLVHCHVGNETRTHCVEAPCESSRSAASLVGGSS